FCDSVQDPFHLCLIILVESKAHRDRQIRFVGYFAFSSVIAVIYMGVVHLFKIMVLTGYPEYGHCIVAVVFLYFRNQHQKGDDLVDDIRRTHKKARLLAADDHTLPFFQSFYIIFLGSAQPVWRHLALDDAGKFLCMLMYRSPEHCIDTFPIIGSLLVIFNEGFIT